ncbi:MAG: LCP family protein [Candidatus Paceibacterota bacterium]|nr:MAG: LCP family protein [Candidatus Paceibacterota bacterium]
MYQLDNQNISGARTYRRVVLGIFGLTFCGIALVAWAQSLRNTSFDITLGNAGTAVIADHVLPPELVHAIEEDAYVMPDKDATLDILVLGMRGKDDPDGGLLTDTILLLRYDKATKKSAFISLPRDLYTRITDTRADKLNAAYEYLGLSGTKKLVSQITGVYIDHAVIFNFTAFQKIVDDLGGITITLATPFEEKQQWGYSFSLPAGENHLNGEQALYYVRSRYSSSDFDRARRQQQVISAIKDKALSLQILSEPERIIALMQTIRSQIVTDINLLDMTSLLSLGKSLSGSTTQKRVVLTPENVLQETRSSAGAYVLLPRDGDWQLVRDFVGATMQ